MPINNIAQTISELPAAGRRGIDVQTIFVNKQEAFQDALTEVFVGQINTLRNQLNTFVEQLNTTTTQINTDAGIATNAAERATAINNELKNVSVGSTITGIPSTPASVTYSPITGKFTFVIPRGEAFQVDARGAITDRSLYDTKYQGFGFLALDESKIYFKMSNTSGDWSIGLYFGKGDGIVSTVFTSTTHPSGLAGQSGATDTYTINYSNLETDTFIVKNGEDGLDNITDTVIGTETTWSSTKIKNLLAQKADKAELDQRIDSLDSTTVKLTDNQTIDGVKTFSSNIVGNITGNSDSTTKLATARTINGVTFDGSANITVSDYTAVKLTENQTIKDVKTFTDSPIVPTPTTDFQAATKKYVDNMSLNPTITAPTITGSAILNGSTNNTVKLTDIVTTLALEVGDVIRIEYSGYNKLHTVEAITSNDLISVNYEHSGNRGKGSLRLPNTTTIVTITRITKWYNASIGLGQAWVYTYVVRAKNTAYQNTTGRPIQLHYQLTENTVFSISNDGVNWFPSSATTQGDNSVAAYIIHVGWYWKISNLPILNTYRTQELR